MTPEAYRAIMDSPHGGVVRRVSIGINVGIAWRPWKGAQGSSGFVAS